VIPLTNVPVGNRAQLIEVQDALRSKLKAYGLHMGDYLRVLRVAPFGGPLLVEVNGREIALGRAVAGKIFVETECGSH